jgi:protoheme IX farnesyltransferase
VILKPLTPQNIVIGGASGAMPPVLGWAAMRNDVGPEAMLLCLIIFLWTPPHFWALALYRTEDYRRAGLPMLPVTHGSQFTRLHVLLYTLVLFAATLLPFVYGMSGWLYLLAATMLASASSAMPGACGVTTVTRWRARHFVFRSGTCRCYSPRCCWITICDHGSGDDDANAPACVGFCARVVRGHRAGLRR